MNSFLIFLCTFVIVFFSILNMKKIKFIKGTDKNLERMEKRVTVETVDDFLTQKTLNDRIGEFLFQRVEKLDRSSSEERRKKIETLLYKVYKDSMTYEKFQEKRLTTAFTAVVCGLIFFLLLKKTSILMGGFALAAAMYYLELSSLKKKAKERDWDYFIFFPDLLTSIAMLFRSGTVNSIFVAFETVVENYKHHPMVAEIRRALDEYAASKNKYDVLTDLAKRVSLKEFTSFISTIIENEKNGMKIGDSIVQYSYTINAKRKILAIAQVKDIPKKMEAIMLLTSMPICSIYIIGPSIMSVAKSLMNQ